MLNCMTKKAGDESECPIFRKDSDALPGDEDDVAQLHDDTASNDRGDPMLRKVCDAVSTNEDAPDPEMGTIIRSRSSGTSIEVQDNLMLGNISDAVSTDENGPDSTGRIAFRSRSHSSRTSIAVDDNLLVHAEIPDDESTNPRMRNLMKMIISCLTWRESKPLDSTILNFKALKWFEYQRLSLTTGLRRMVVRNANTSALS